MNVILKDKQIYHFLIRRFSIEQLDELVERVQDEMENNDEIGLIYKSENVIYDIVREFISWNVSDIVDRGVEQEFWDSYMAYETPLVYYIKQKLSLD